MNGIQRRKSAHLTISLFLIIALELLVQVNSTRSEEIEPINSNQGFDFVVLLQGQEASLTVTYETDPFSFHYASHTIWITSIGNKTLSGKTSAISVTSVRPEPDPDLPEPSQPPALKPTGLWFTTIIGTGGRNWADLSSGVIPWDGQSAAIDISENISFAISISSLFIFVNVTDPEAESYLVKYTISISQ